MKQPKLTREMLEAALDPAKLQSDGDDKQGPDGSDTE